MPRALKSDKFFIYAAKKSGYWKGKRMLGVNDSYEGEARLTVQDLVDFLKDEEIELSKVVLSDSFITYATEESPKK